MKQGLICRRRSSRNALTLVELLVVVATIGVLSSILFPVLREASFVTSKTSARNVRKIGLAAIHYGDDYDERIPIVANGQWRNMKNVRDGQLTQYGDQRTDLWPLLIFPYLKDRQTYVDPTRADKYGVFAGPPLADGDPGFTPEGATFRNQNRFPFFGMNYLFLSPFAIPASKMEDASPTDFMAGEVHRFFQADDPANTVFFAPSMEGRMPQSENDNYGVPEINRGFFGINAPGMWILFAASTSQYVAQWTGTNCSGDWCGADIDPTTPGVQTSQGYFYEDPKKAGNNVSFLDGHVRFVTTAGLAAGTDYLTATPNDGGSGAFGGGAHIIDKSKYLWNLDDNYYGG